MNAPSADRSSLNAPDATPSLDIAAGAAAALRRDDFDRDVWCLMGAPVDMVDIDGALGAIDAAIRTRQPLSFVTPNVNIFRRALAQPQARAELINADLSLIDGAPLVWMARMLGLPVKSRVAGSDLFEAMRRRPGFGGRRIKVFFFGGQDGAAQAAAAALNKENGSMEAVGWLNPGFGNVEAMSADSIIDDINSCAPDFVVVALGAAKGQRWIEANRARLSAPVIAHLGAVINFTAGSVARAPVWMQRIGLEWAWRIKEEPSLWRRYFDDAIGLAGIILTVLLPQILRGRVSQDASGGAAAANVVLDEGEDETIIQLTGSFSGRGSLAPVRAAFRTAAGRSVGGRSVAAKAHKVRLDMAGVDAFDAALLGQLLMLEKHLSATGAVFSLSGVREAHQATLRANKMDYVRQEAADTNITGAAREMPPVQQAAR